MGCNPPGLVRHVARAAACGFEGPKEGLQRGSPPIRVSSVGECPMGTVAAACYLAAMNPLLLIIVLLLLFGGGGFYVGGPAYGGGGLGLIVLICLVVYLMGGMRPKK